MTRLTTSVCLVFLAFGTTCLALSSKTRQCICAGHNSLQCMQLVGVFSDDSFVISPTKVLDIRFPLDEFSIQSAWRCSLARRISRRWLFNTPVLGYESKSDCTGVTTTFHMGLPANQVSVEHHTGTDGTDTKVEGSLDGIKVGVHGGTDADGNKQGGASIGVGVGKFGEVGLHLDGGASGVSVGGHGKVEVPGVGKAEGQVDVNNQGHVIASGNANGPIKGICVTGSKDVTKFIDNANKNGVPNAVQQHIQTHGDGGTGFNPATFMQQAGMSNIQSMSGMNGMGGMNGGMNSMGMNGVGGMSGGMNSMGLNGMGGAGGSPYGFQPGSLG